MKTRQFVDSTVIEVRAGRGGDGSASFRREKFVPKGGPDGGDGGRGGNVVLVGDEDADSLVALFFDPRKVAEDGGAGSGRGKHGKNGADLFVRVPLGTAVKDEYSGMFVGEIVEHGQTLVVARGGRGGLGNIHWKRPDHQAPREFTPGADGEEFTLRLDLNIMADAGLVGFPSAGKSSLLRCVTAAKPKVAAYHFTTLRPIVGTVVFPEKFTSFRIADIPGLIENAHEGAGLGLGFLRHIERTRVLVFVIDMAGTDGRDPADDYRTLLHELEMRDPELLTRSRVVVANKMDIPEAAENLEEFRRDTGVDPICISAATGAGIPEFLSVLERIIKPQPKTSGRNTAVLADGGKFKVRVMGKTGEPVVKRTAKKESKPAKTGREPRRGYTPPRELDGRGEHPNAGDVVSEDYVRSAAPFLKL